MNELDRMLLELEQKRVEDSMKRNFKNLTTRERATLPMGKSPVGMQTKGGKRSCH